ncbi:MAG TPA: HepT-like ribonuclease domain-containing protein [Sphingobium sp.]
MSYRDIDRLELIAELIGHVQRRLAGKSQDEFLRDQDEMDLTSFRMMHIGEASHKLSAALKARQPHIPWSAIYAMRNVISHDYFGVNATTVWHAATTELDGLLLLCREELSRLSE